MLVITGLHSRVNFSEFIRVHHAIMAHKKSTSTAEVNTQLDELSNDAYCDDEQLTAFEQDISDALESPVEVYVLGVLMSLT